MLKTASITPELFHMFPGFYRRLVFVAGASDGPPRPHLAKSLETLANTQAEIAIESNPYLKAWDEAHRRFGSNPNKYPPSIKSLLKMIRSGRPLPYINTVVSIFNIISLKYILPCGGDDVAKIRGSMILGVAKGDESFLPLGQKQFESPVCGEVIYFDDQTNNVMCRRWNWRNSEYTKITATTKDIVINLDCLPPFDRSVADDACAELAALIARECRADVRTDFLNEDRPKVELPF
jgi:DNA/RNA-binding domain of Phe-tRNA-synthetase-like protein